MTIEQIVSQIRNLAPADKLALYELLSEDPDITEDDEALIRVADARLADRGQTIPHEEVARDFGL